MSKKNHHRDCAIALLNFMGYPIPKNSNYIYVAPHGLGQRDISGLFDFDIWIPEIKLNVRGAASSHANMSTSIKEHDLKNPEHYFPSNDIEFYLVTWAVKNHKLVYRFFALPSMEELRA